MANVIKIKDCDPVTEQLTLTNNGDNGAHRKDKVKWKIKTSGVKKIHSIVVKSDPEHIWKVQPHPDGDDWEGEIRDDAPDGAVYTYGIWWIPKDSSDIKRYDPKITIQPDKTFLLELLLALMAFLGGIFAFRLFARKR